MFFILGAVGLVTMFTGVCMDDEDAGMLVQLTGAAIGLSSLFFA